MERKSRTRKVTAIAAACAAAALLAAGCSSSSGGKAAEQSANVGSAGKANTARIKIAMITHAAPGDTFWDLIRKGAQAADAKDNVELLYSNAPQTTTRASL